MAATMKDVAERAGVSIATVSFVVNNTKRVTPQTRLKIETAMAELGFRRNLVARALASRRTRIIALVYPGIEHRIGRIADFITSAAQTAREADHHLVVWPIGEPTELRSLLGQGLVDGVLVMEVQLEDERVEALRSLDIPFALIGRTRDVSGLDYVDIDFEASMQLAVDHLLGLGHREILLLAGSQEMPTYRLYGPYEREEVAFRRIAAEHGMQALIERCDPTAVAGRVVAARLAELAPGATAVIACDEAAAAGLVAGLHALGRRVPDEISVMSVLTPGEMAAASDPALTRVAGPGLELGALGARVLLRRLQGEPPEPPVLRPGRLELGESTGPAPVAEASVISDAPATARRRKPTAGSGPGRGRGGRTSPS